MKKSKIKINFVDFWPGFQKDNNYFYHLLSTRYDIAIDESDPDLLFFSVDYARAKERDRYKNHRCKKIFYTGESVSANFDSNESIGVTNYQAQYSIGKCDYAFTYDFCKRVNHYRLPLWTTYIDWFGKGSYTNPSFLLPEDKISDNEFILKPKNKFCATIFSNPISSRIEAFEKLSQYKQVDGYGMLFGNYSQGELDKYQILSNYKFSICFENKSYPGYYTEKPFHAKTSGTIPIYFSDEQISNDMNEKAFINYGDFDSMDSLVKYVKKVDQNDELYKSYADQPLFKNNIIKDEFKPNAVLSFFENTILK